MTNKKRFMKKFGPMLAAITVVVAIFISGCSGSGGADDPDTSAALDSVNPAASQVSYVEDGNAASSKAGGEHGSLGEGNEAGGEHGSFGEGAVTVSQGAHERDSGEGGEGAADGGEESGTEYALDQTYDVTRNGARLVLVYDAQNNAFIGAVANTTNNTLPNVRVEVHLSNGTELGPTTPADLEPGEKMNVTLQATSESFDGWSAHPEVGGREGGGEHSGESSGEHGGEGNGEHDGEGSGEHGNGG